MSKTAKTAWIAILATLLTLCGFASTVQAQYWFNNEWNGAGYPTTSNWKWWWDSVEYRVNNNFDPSKPIDKDNAPYLGWTDNWSFSSNDWAATIADYGWTDPVWQVDPYVDPTDWTWGDIEMGSGGDWIVVSTPYSINDYGIQFVAVPVGSGNYNYDPMTGRYEMVTYGTGTHAQVYGYTGDDTYVVNILNQGGYDYDAGTGGYVVNPAGTGEYDLATVGPFLVKETRVETMRIAGSGWAFQGSTIHGYGSLQSSASMTIMNTLAFDQGVEVTGGNYEIYSQNPFGQYVYDPLLPKKNTVFFQQGASYSRTYNVTDDDDLQNRSVIEEGVTLTFRIPQTGKIEIRNVDVREAAENTDVKGGAVFLKVGADIAREGLGGGGVPGLLHVHDNMAYRGGGFYSLQNLTIHGNTRIENNKAVAEGGAIFMEGSVDVGDNRLVLDSTIGDIVFENNTMRDSGDPTDLANDPILNSIFLSKNTDMSITGHRYVYINDGIQSGDALYHGNNSLDINIGAVPGTGSVVGFVQFGGNSNSILNPAGMGGGAVTLRSGEFRILEGGHFETRGGQSTFTTSNGTKLAGRGTIGAVAGFKIFGNLAPDSYVYDVPSDLQHQGTFNPSSGTAIGYLKLKGSVELDGTVSGNTPGATFLVDIAAAGSKLNAVADFTNADASVINSDIVMVGTLAGTAENVNGKILLNLGEKRTTVDIETDQVDNAGKYVIASAEKGFVDALDMREITHENVMNYFNPVTTKGKELTGRAGASLYIERGLLDTTKTGDDREYDLVLYTSNDANLYVLWTGEGTGTTWANGTPGDPGNNNWRSTRSTILTDFDDNAKVEALENGAKINGFKDGDYVFFNNVVMGESKHNLTIDIGGEVYVSGMDVVDGQDYTFRGGTIIGSTQKNGVDFLGVVSTAKLRVTSTDVTVPTHLTLLGRTAFEKGTELGGGATITIDHEESLGAFKALADAADSDEAALWASQLNGVVKLTTYIDNDRREIGGDGYGTIALGPNLVGGTVQNHFWITDGNQLTLSYGAAGLTVAGVDTTGYTTLRGGAFEFGNNASLVRDSGLLVLDGNTAEQGGGMWAHNTLTVGGNTVFKNNTATFGSDIYMQGDGASVNMLTLDTTNGDILFTNPAYGAASGSIYLNKGTTLTASGNGTIFGGPIQTGPGGNNSLIVGSGSDAVVYQLTGANRLSPDDTTGGNVTVNTGATLRLADSATLATGGRAGTRVHITQGGRLAGNGTLYNTAGSTVLPGNSGFLISGILSPDAATFTSDLDGGTKNVDIADADRIATLTLVGKVTFAGAQFDVDLGAGNTSDLISITGPVIFAQNGTENNTINILSVVDGTGSYKLIASDTAFTQTDEDILALFDPLTNSGRQTAELQIVDNREIWLDYTYNNLAILWTGAVDGAWDLRNKLNWRNGNDPEIFDDGDYVIFDNSAAIKAVDVQGDYTVSGMEVVGGDYTFTGTGTITGSTTTGNYVPEPGQVAGQLQVKGNGTVARIGVETSFEEGTLLDGATIYIGNDKALGTYDNAQFDAVTPNKSGYVQTDGTAKIAADSTQTVTNRIEVATGTLNIDAEGETTNLAIDGVDAATTGTVKNGGAVHVAADANLSINETGDGTVTFSNNTGQNGGAIAADENLAIHGGTTFTGNTATGLGGAVYMGGLGTTNLLTLDATGGDITFATATDTIHLNGDVTTNATGTGTITHHGAFTSAGGGNILNVDMTWGNGVLDGVLQYAAAATGADNVDTLNVNSGTMRLLGAAAFQAADATVGPNGILAGSGTLVSGNVINVTGTLAADSYDALGAGSDVGQLNLSGDALFNGATLAVDLAAGNAADLIHIDDTIAFGAGETVIDLRNSLEGTYDILTALGTDFTTDFANWKDHFSINIATSDRWTHTLQLKGTDTIQLDIVSGGNMKLLWTGDVDAHWSSTSAVENWDIYGTTNPIDFIDGDYVVFSASQRPVAPSTITLDNNVIVSQMDIEDGTFIFAPGAGNSITGVAGFGDGALHLNDGVDVTMNVATDFEQGVSMTGNIQFTLGHDNALGTYAPGQVGTKRGVVDILAGTGYWGDAFLTAVGDRTITNAFNVIDDLSWLYFETAQNSSLTLAANGDNAINLIGANTAVLFDATGGPITVEIPIIGTDTNSVQVFNAGDVTFNGAITLGDDSTIAVGSSGTTTFNGAVTIADGGMFNLFGTGDTTFNGTLTAGNGNRFNIATTGDATFADTVSFGSDNTFEITNGTAAKTVTFNGMNGTGGDNSLTKDDASTLVFNGTNVLNAAAGANATQIGAGTMHLNAGATYESAGAGSTFDLAAGATLTGTGTVRMGDTITIQGTLDAGDAPGTVGTLTFDGDVVFNDMNLTVDFVQGAGGVYTTDQIIVENGGVDFTGQTELSQVNLADWRAGDYKLIATDTGIGTSDDPYDYFALNEPDSDERRTSTLVFDGNDLWLHLSCGRNTDLLWTGSSSNKWGTSSTDDLNWVEINDPTKVPTYFTDGDTITFDATGRNKDIQIDANERRTSGMYVLGGAYSFSGGNIHGDNPTSEEVSGDGALHISGAGTSVTFNNNTYFIGGTQLGGGATVELAHTDAAGVSESLGRYAGPGGLAGTVTLTPDQDGKADGMVRARKSMTTTNHYVADTPAAATLTFDIIGDDTVLTIFDANADTEDGGAIRLGLNNDIARTGNGTLHFDGNLANRGGAIAADGSLTLGGNTYFTGNMADAVGGAIYMAGLGADNTLTLDTTKGNIGFNGNMMAGNTRNAIYLEKDTDLTITGGNGVYFGDSIRSGASGRNAFTMNGTGNVLFNTSAGTSTIGGAIALNSGTTRLALGAKLQTGGSAYAALIDDQATLMGGGALNASNGMTVKGTLSADAYIYTLAADGTLSVDDSASVGKLSLGGNVVFDGMNLIVDLAPGNVSDEIAISGKLDYTGTGNTLDLTGWYNGTYDIVTTSGGVQQDSDGKWTITVNGEELAIDGRLHAKVQNSGDGKNVQLVTASDNASLTWNNGAGTMEWNNGDMNWHNNTTGKNDLFLDGDTVAFNGNGQGDISVAGDVTVGDMVIRSGNYSFTGASISGRTGISSLPGTTGSLRIEGGSVLFDTAVDFEGGIAITGAGTLVGATANGDFTTGGTFLLDAGTALIFTPKTGSIVAGDVQLLGDVYVNLPEGLQDNDYISDVITSGTTLDTSRLTDLFTATYGLHGQTPVFGQADTTMSLDYTLITPSEFAAMNGLGWNESRTADALTEAFADAPSPAFEDLHELMASYRTNGQVQEVLNQLRGSEMAADALTMSLWGPWRTVFNKVNRDQRSVTPTAFQSARYRGQLGSQTPSTKDFWIEAYHRTIDASHDNSARSYTMDRTGTTLGLDKKVSVNTTIGAVINYATPTLHSQFGKIEANDWGFAGYVKHYLTNDIYVNGYLGYGHQEFRYRRDLWLGGRNYRHRADYDGNSLYASAEIIRPFLWKNGLTAMLVAGLDFQQAWNGDVIESGSHYAQRLNDGELSMTTLRGGLNGRWRVIEDFSVDFRLQYLRQLEQENYANVNMTFIEAPVGPYSLRGIDLGPDQLNVGIGCQAYLTAKRTMYFFVDYDYDVGFKAVAHTGQIGFVRNW